MTGARRRRSDSNNDCGGGNRDRGTGRRPYCRFHLLINNKTRTTTTT